MPFAVLVSALGAIVATTIALFGQSWTALRIAPVVGALLGLLLAILSLRRHDLPLRSKLEDYRSAAGVSETLMPYLNSALGIGLIVSLIELPSIVLGQDVALPIHIIGWVVVLGGTAYRSWRVNGAPGRLDVFQITGGAACIVLCGWIMYVFAVEIRPGQTVSMIYLAKVIFILNGFASFLSAVLACFGLAVMSSLGAGAEHGR